jgi:hypothetical protein
LCPIIFDLSRRKERPVRFESSVTSISWIPSEAIESVAVKLPFQIGLTHYDDPPPEVLDDLESLRNSGAFRFANQLSAWVDVQDDRIMDFGQSGRGHLGITSVNIGPRELSFAAIPLPDLRPEPEVGEGWVRFTQIAGGRTALPTPRRVRRKPFIQVTSPPAWTSLTLTIHADGSSESKLIGASPFPRHWIYGNDGELVGKSGLIDFKLWYREAFGGHTPWGAEDSPALATAAESALERELSRTIMRGGAKPRFRRLRTGQTLVEQDEVGEEIFLLLDGVLTVEVNGKELASLGPGAVVGERAVFEGGARTATLRAASPCRVGIAEPKQLSNGALSDLSLLHKREATL